MSFIKSHKWLFIGAILSIGWGWFGWLNIIKPLSIERFPSHYGKDKNRVYFTYYVIPQAKPNSFELLSDECIFFSRDRDRLFDKNYIIEGVNPDTFTIIDGYCNKIKDGGNVYERTYEDIPFSSDRAIRWVMVS